MPKLNLYEIRRQRGMSQTELAELANISHGYISELENNLKSPTINILCKLAKALDCTLDDLVDCD
ncbi:MAG: helix-turn-helix transcriptional regulator [Tissierella sp.]|nr:helix-turn-helix transcriptional regulator [Tissierella sp.]